MGKKIIHNMDEFYETYLPKFAEKYPITMRVNKEEEKLIHRLRGKSEYEIKPTPKEMRDD